MQDKKREQWISLIGVVALAILLPAILRATNQVMRLLVSAEGRLAAIAVETDQVLGPLPAPWRSLAQGGDNLETFLDGVIEDVTQLEPEYIRIDHIYDQLVVVGRNEGRLTYDWTRLDTLVNKMATTGAKPFLSLSYMPPAISSGDILSAPQDWNLWKEAVQKTIEHYSGEMGIDNVYYEVWNEPDLFGEWKMGGKKDYKQLYLWAARGAAAATGTRPFKLGGPGTTGLYKNWIDGFFPYVLENRLRLDFFSWHRYDLDIEKYISDVQNVDRWLDRHPYFSNVEKVITELGPSSKAGGDNDNKTGAAHLVAVMRELMFKVSRGFSFAVNGDFGILGKPRSEALKMLTGLGDQRLAITGEGTWVRAIGAQKDNAYQVILANYDPKGTHSEVVPVTFISHKEREFTLRRTALGGNTVSKKVATSEAVLQDQVPLTPNSVVMLELEPVITPQ